MRKFGVALLVAVMIMVGTSGAFAAKTIKLSHLNPQ
jgi:hypothetical protein